MPTRLRRRFLVISTAAILLITAGSAYGDEKPNLLQLLGDPTCLDPLTTTPEQYGPTDIGATVGNGRLSVAVNSSGTLSVLKWPSPSYYDQLRYKTIGRDLPLLGLPPNDGAFSGLALRLADGSRTFTWLRDLKVGQRYASDDSDTVSTNFRSDQYGLTVQIDDTVPSDADVLMRRHTLQLDANSTVASVDLVAFANLHPVVSKLKDLPLADWCWDKPTDIVGYHGAADAMVYGLTGVDVSTLKQSSVAIAIGANKHSSGHQVGVDRHHGLSLLGPPDAYDEALKGTLSGNDRAGPAKVDVALSIPFDGEPVTVSFAAASTRDQALALLDQYRGRDPVQMAQDKRQQDLQWMADAPLPLNAPPSVVRLSKRALVSLHQAIDTSAAPNGNGVAIVASIATQSPYGEDWARDGSFLNETLDVIGHHDLVERHNAFYADVQRKLRGLAPPGSSLTRCLQPAPSGTWNMNNYADGIVGGPYPWEIDETSLAMWGLWRHYERGSATTGYLESVYPAIRNTAEFLVAFRDPSTKLTPGGACEDDNLPTKNNPTMDGMGPVLLAIRSAAQAAQVLGRTDDAQRYRNRVAELEEAINTHYNVEGGAYTTDYEPGGYVLWPVVVQDYQSPRMAAQAAAVWKSVEPSFLAPNGPRTLARYESKALLGLAHYYQAVNPAGLQQVKNGLNWIADVEAAYQNTGILGEAWYIRDGKLLSVVAQPHVWEQALFYLAALQTYGSAPYTPGQAGTFAP